MNSSKQFNLLHGLLYEQYPKDSLFFPWKYILSSWTSCFHRFFCVSNSYRRIRMAAISNYGIFIDLWVHSTWFLFSFWNKRSKHTFWRMTSIFRTFFLRSLRQNKKWPHIRKKKVEFLCSSPQLSLWLSCFHWNLRILALFQSGQFEVSFSVNLDDPLEGERKINIEDLLFLKTHWILFKNEAFLKILISAHFLKHIAFDFGITESGSLKWSSFLFFFVKMILWMARIRFLSIIFSELSIHAQISFSI